jgi:nucleotide-binding universal stress UspA family protein
LIYQKILVPFDGSEHSWKALEASIQLAKNLNSKLALLTVYSVTDVATPEPELSANTRRSVITTQNVRDSCEELLEEASLKVRSERIEVEIEVAGGDAVDVIARKSKEGKFDLIVMGARGLSTLKKILVGSVSEGVIKNAPCPVLIVK